MAFRQQTLLTGPSIFRSLASFPGSLSRASSALWCCVHVPYTSNASSQTPSWSLCFLLDDHAASSECRLERVLSVVLKGASSLAWGVPSSASISCGPPFQRGVLASLFSEVMGELSVAVAWTDEKLIFVENQRVAPFSYTPAFLLVHKFSEDFPSESREGEVILAQHKRVLTPRLS